MNFIFAAFWKVLYVGRKERQRKKTFVIFCEGKSEFNYFNAITPANVDIVLKTLDMEGGGYKSFLDCIKKNGSINRLATFIIVDGDRAKNVPGELAALQNLQKYCDIQNKRDNKSPYFLIVNSPDFEYISCLHDPKYSGGDTTRHIEKIFNFKTLADFKKHTHIFHFLNCDSRNYQHMLEKIRFQLKLISNTFERQDIFILFSKTITHLDLIDQKNSNIEEFFDIVF